VAVLDPAIGARREWRDAGRLLRLGLSWTLYAFGWLVAKSLRAVGTTAAWLLFGVGWVAGRVLWPAACWAGRAVALGWDEGRKPGFKR
jgi:hypothetical protein